MERTAKGVIERSKYEDKYGVEVKQDEVTGETSVRDREKDEVELEAEQKRVERLAKKGIVVRTKEEKRQLRRLKEKEKRMKKKRRLRKKLMTEDGEWQEDRAVASGPAGLQECEILCESSKKDEYLYYFLCRYPGRTIVFVNAISSIRRLISLLGVLKLPVLGLHSNMQQRARLKTVDRFMASDDVVLVATDVAARGIDVKDVKYVIHYQIAKSTDTYVHRRGRTARAGKEGMSLALVGEAEVQLMRRTLRELGYDAARQLATFPVGPI